MNKRRRVHMMAGLFVIYLASQLLILWKKEHAAFAIIVINIALSFFMLMHHATDILKIRL